MVFNWPYPKQWNTKYSSLPDDGESDRSLDAEPKQSTWIDRDQKKSPWLSIYMAGTNLAIVVLLVVILVRPSQKTSAPEYSLPELPHFPSEMKTFQEDPLYMARPSEESDVAWERLGGPDPTERINKRGFIYLKGEGLPDGLKVSGEVEMIYGVGVLHQLHCLGGIRKMMWDLVYGRVNPAHLLEMSPNDTWENQTFETAIHGLWHVSHCFDIVRQSLMCSADMSIEWPVAVDGRYMFNGLHGPHECKNWEAIWEFLESHM